MEKQIIDVSTIIVNYNTKDITRNCLESVYKQTKDISFEVIVSDNGSTDGSVEMIKAEFPQVILIENNANLGFGAANNRGLKVAKGKYIFYLNSDTVLLNNAVKLFFDYWENSAEKVGIGALGCNLQNEKGDYIHSFGRFPTYKKEIRTLIKQNVSICINGLLCFLKIPNLRRKAKIPDVYNGEVEYITGADLFLRNDDFAKFDEDYFLYFEESDLELKMKNHNLKRLLIDTPKIVHLSGKSNNAKHYSIDRYISFSSQQILYSRIIYLKKNSYKKLPLLFVYLLEQLYLCQVWLFSKTKPVRKNLRSLYVS